MEIIKKKTLKNTKYIVFHSTCSNIPFSLNLTTICHDYFVKNVVTFFSPTFVPTEYSFHSTGVFETL